MYKLVVFFVVILFGSCGTPHFTLLTDVVTYKDVDRTDSVLIHAGEIVQFVPFMPKKKTRLVVLDSVFFSYIKNKGNAYYFIDSVKRDVFDDGPYYLPIEEIDEFQKDHKFEGVFKSLLYWNKSNRYREVDPKE